MVDMIFRYRKFESSVVLDGTKTSLLAAILSLLFESSVVLDCTCQQKLDTGMRVLDL